MASAGFYWCGSENQPDLVRCFVCLKEFEEWDPDDNPRLQYHNYYNATHNLCFWVFLLCNIFIGRNTKGLVMIVHLEN